MKPAGCAHAADHGKRLVIKIGSSTLTTSESKIDYAYLAEVTDQVARVRAAETPYRKLERHYLHCLGELGLLTDA